MLSLLYSLGVLIAASLVSYVFCEYKLVQLRNPEYVRNLIDIELPEFKNVETIEDDDYPINHNSYSIWHIVEFESPLSKTAIQKIEQVRSKEKWPDWTDECGWGLFYPESNYQYEYIDRSAFRKFELELSTTKAEIYYEVWDSFYWMIAGVLLLCFTLWIVVMMVWGVILIIVNTVSKFKLRISK